MSYYDYDENDIAKTLRRAMAQNASFDDVSRLVRERNRKIDAGGEETAMYKDDALTQEANAYLADRAAKPQVDLERFQTAREQVAAENLREANRQHNNVYKSGVARVETEARGRERAASDAYRKSELADNEHLAAMGLGRGAGKPTSGYGESMRTAAMLDYQNALGNIRREEDAEKADLYEKYMQNLHESRQAYNKERSEIAKDGAETAVEQFNKDRDYVLAEGDQRREENRWNQTFDAEQQQRREETKGKQEEAAYERAMEMFEKMGVVGTPEMAEILGIPIGTQMNVYDRMLELFKETGEVTTQEMAEILGLPIGTKVDGYNSMLNLFKETGEVTTKEMAKVLGLPLGTKADSYNLMLQTFKETGEVTTQEMANILGLPIGTKTNERIAFEKQHELDWAEFNQAQQWHEDDEAYRAKVLALRKPVYVTRTPSSTQNFNNAFNLFKAVGEVITDEMADALGLPMGTQYWQYSQSQQELDFETGIY